MDNAIHRINRYPLDIAIILVSLLLIQWIAIYPVDSAIHRLNNWGLVYKVILLIDIVSLFIEKSHRSPSDLETRIAHRPKDTVTLGFARHKSNLSGHERLAPQSKNIFSDCDKDKKLV